MSTFVITLVCLRYLFVKCCKCELQANENQYTKKKEKEKRKREREKILCLFGSDVLITTDTQNSVQLK